MFNSKIHSCSKFVEAKKISIIIICIEILSLGYVSSLFAENCQLFEIETHNLIGFVELSKQYKIQSLRKNACDLVNDGKWTNEEGNRALQLLITRCANCRGPNLNLELWKILEDVGFPETVKPVYEKFCHDTFHPRSLYGALEVVKLKVLKERIQMLFVETRCEIMIYYANPPSWMNIFKPDVPSLKRLENQAYSICEGMRSGKISINDGIFRFKQEVDRAMKHLGPETAKEVGKKISGPINFLIKTFLK